MRVLKVGQRWRRRVREGKGSPGQMVDSLRRQILDEVLLRASSARPGPAAGAGATNGSSSSSVSLIKAGGSRGSQELGVQQANHVTNLLAATRLVRRVQEVQRVLLGKVVAEVSSHPCPAPLHR